jgi:hypothetical protein
VAREAARQRSPRRRRPAASEKTLDVLTGLSIALGATFGVLAGACAFAITYGECKRNWSFRGSATKTALRSGAVAFAFFFFAAMGLVAILRLVM